MGAPMNTTSWLRAAQQELGVREAPGKTNNPTIIQYGREAGIDWFADDSIAWCAVFVNAMLVRTGYPSTKSALARSFIEYGTPLSKPVPGAIVVFPRGSNPLYGHVGIVESVGNGTVTLINGNISDEVRRSTFRTSTILPNGIRWPPGARPPLGVATRAPAEPAAPLGRRLLRRGDTGDDVEELQRALASLGLMQNDPNVATFGPDTEDAVRQFQRQEGLLIDGIVGPATISAIEGALSARAAAKKARTAAEKAAQPAVAATAGVGAAATAGVATVVDATRQVQSLNDGTTLGVVLVAMLVIGLVGYVAYRIWTSRAARDAAE